MSAGAKLLVDTPDVAIMRWPNLPPQLVAIELADVVVVARLDTGQSMTFRKGPVRAPESEEERDA